MHEREALNFLLYFDDIYFMMHRNDDDKALCAVETRNVGTLLPFQGLNKEQVTVMKNLCLFAFHTCCFANLFLSGGHLMYF